MPPIRKNSGGLHLSAVSIAVLAAVINAPRPTSAAEIAEQLKLKAQGKRTPVHLITGSLTLALRNGWIERHAGRTSRYSSTANGRAALMSATVDGLARVSP